MNLTRREKQALIIAAIILLAIVIINPNQQDLNGWEIPYLLFIVFPLSVYVTADPERRKEG